MCVLQSNYPSDKSGAASISTAIYDILLSRYRGDCTKIDNTNSQSTLKKYNMMLKLIVQFTKPVTSWSVPLHLTDETSCQTTNMSIYPTQPLPYP